MVEIVKKGRFRIYVHDLKTKAARSITIADDKSLKNVDELKRKISECLSKS